LKLPANRTSHNLYSAYTARFQVR